MLIDCYFKIMHNSVRYTLVSCFLSSIINTVSSSYVYCESGLCTYDQYCCREGVCCDKSINYTYFWLGLAVVLFIIAIMAGLRFLHKRRKLRYNAYSLVPNAVAET